MRFKKFFKSRTVRVITAVVFILCTLFTAVLPSYAEVVPKPETLPDVLYQPPQIPDSYSYEYGLPISSSSIQQVFQVFWYQNYFGGFNSLHPVALVTIPSGDSHLTYLYCTDYYRDGIYPGMSNGSPTFHLYFAGPSFGDDAGGTLFYFLLTDYGFVYEKSRTFSASELVNSQFLPLVFSQVMWYVNVSVDSYSNTNYTVLSDWSMNDQFYYRPPGFADDDNLDQLHSAVGKWFKYYETATTLRDRQEIYDEAYDIGYEVGFENGYEGGQDDGYLDGYDVGFDEGFIEGTKQIGAYLDIPSIISSVASFVPNFINDSLDFDLFGINVAGLIMMVLAASLAIFIITLIGRFK